MKIKTAELIGPALDWAVAKCGDKLKNMTQAKNWADLAKQRGGMIPTHGPVYSPSTNPAQAWPIIERKGIGFHRNGKRTFAREDMRYEANLILNQDDAPICRVGFRGTGPTALIAAMRCHVASELGAEIEVPDEFIEE